MKESTEEQLCSIVKEIGGDRKQQYSREVGQF